MLALHAVCFFAKPIYMKQVLLGMAGVLYGSMLAAQPPKEKPNIFIVTTDGFRWQEIFNGADPALLTNSSYVQDSSLLLQLYGGPTKEIRRQKLLPFFWSTIATHGQLYGNRSYHNNADVHNLYKISYSGYNEIFTGYADSRLIVNKPRYNDNENLPAYLNSLPAYQGRVAAFSSWNIFPYILNEPKSNFPVNSGYENFPATDTLMKMIDKVQNSIHDRPACRSDMLTFLMAKQYLRQQHPKVMILSLGETDEFAHEGQYDMYLQRANDVDRMLAELWYYMQTDPFYKNNTTFFITTDHGRGNKNSSWPGHHLFIKGSGEIWLGMIGAGIAEKGEIKTKGQIYQDQIAQTIAGLLGEKFETAHKTGRRIPLPAVETPLEPLQVLSASLK